MDNEHDITTEATLTPETVSPTDQWPKPVFKRKLAIKRRLALRRDGFGSLSICQPSPQPKLSRIRASEEELQTAVKGLNASVETTRLLHAKMFHGLQR